MIRIRHEIRFRNPDLKYDQDLRYLTASYLHIFDVSITYCVPVLKDCWRNYIHMELDNFVSVTVPLTSLSFKALSGTTTIVSNCVICNCLVAKDLFVLLFEPAGSRCTKYIIDKVAFTLSVYLLFSIYFCLQQSLFYSVIFYHATHNEKV